MDYRKFIAELPSLYHQWGEATVQPKSEQFQGALSQLEGMTTANVLQLLNFAVSCMEPDEVYCEVGCYQGSTLIGALLNNPDRMAYAVDNFAEFDFLGENEKRLIDNLSSFNLAEQVFFCSQDFEAFFASLRELQADDRIGVYFYDGAHDYRSQLMGLLLAKSFLADQALIIVDDSNWEAVQQANWDFIAAHSECQLLLDLPTPAKSFDQMASCSFWNGLQILSWDVQATHTHAWTSLEQARKPVVIQAIYHLPPVFAQPTDTTQEELTAAERQPKAEQLEAIQQQYLEILQQDDSRADVWHALGAVYYQTEQDREALTALSKAVELNPSIAFYHASLGLVLERAEKFSDAARSYQQAIALDPTFLDAYNNLGNLVAEHGDPQQAERIYQQAIAQDPHYLGSYLNFGNILLVQGKVEQAIAVYETARAIEPGNADLLNNLIVAQELIQDQEKTHLFAGDNLYNRQQYQAAVSHYQALLDRQALTDSGYLALADCYEKLKQPEAAATVYQQGIDRHPHSIDLQARLIRVWQEIGQTKAAIEQATQSASQFPDELLFRLQKDLLLPVLYQTQAEISFYQQRFTQGLEAMPGAVSLDTTSARKNALAAIEQFNNFFLICQPANHRDSQQVYGQLVHQVMAANYPQWVQPLAMPPVEGKIRVGYVSGCLREHTVGKLMVGWFRNHDRQRFQIHSYHLYDIDDSLSQEFRQHSDTFYQIPDDLAAVCQQIRADQPHILVFLEIGMQPIMSLLAALRLAPIQCTTWAHPMTSGLPTVDYFLSSDLMEPETAQDHYSEKLIRLPNLAISFAKPAIPQPAKPRSSFQLRDDAIVYLACQTLIKYLPAQDALFAAIAHQVPNAQFVFVARPNPPVANQFQQRLKRAFAQVGLDSAAHCVMLPPLNQADYWNLNQVSDVFLDSCDWSGGHTTLEAIACNLPIVSLPGELMRGRHSYAILKLLGITDILAQTAAEYIEIAVKLGRDRTWRQHIIQRMIDQQPHLYDDKTCITALEGFYQQVVEEGMRDEG